MFTVQRTYKVFSFSELSEIAKDKVRQWYLDDDLRTDIFTEDCLYRLGELFPNSDLKVEYSLGYCQGDGLNIYGDLRLDDVMEHIKDNFTEKELRFFNWVFREIADEYTMPANDWYHYCICDRHYYLEDVVWECENNYYRNIPYDLIERFEGLIQDYMSELCGQLEQDGYKWFYEPDDDEIEDCCEANEWYFDEDGDLFVFSEDEIISEDEDGISVEVEIDTDKLLSRANTAATA